jgi:hypothetical protein
MTGQRICARTALSRRIRSGPRTSLLQSLELFVIAGWPAARRLVYRLDEAFR